MTRFHFWLYKPHKPIYIFSLKAATSKLSFLLLRYRAWWLLYLKKSKKCRYFVHMPYQKQVILWTLHGRLIFEWCCSWWWCYLGKEDSNGNQWLRYWSVFLGLDKLLTQLDRFSLPILVLHFCPEKCHLLPIQPQEFWSWRLRYC